MRILMRLILPGTVGLLAFASSRVSNGELFQESSRGSAGAPITAKSRFAAFNGIRIHYLEWGHDGPPVVLLHGLKDDARVWEASASRLGADFHVLAPDRRGAGSSDKPETGSDSQTLIGDVIGLIRYLKLGTVTLVGHSSGAEIALMTAIQRPEMVRSLVMIDGGFWPSHTGSQYDPEPLYPRVFCPTLLIVARRPRPVESELAEYRRLGRDYFKEVESGERHAMEVADRKLPRGQMVLIENTSHWIQMDQPQLLAQTIRQFLRAN